MDKKQQGKDINGNINVELGGMGLYGTTSNVEIAGYEASGDIENAGKLDHFKKEGGHRGATAAIKDQHQRD